MSPGPERAYRLLGLAYDSAGNAIVWTPRFGFCDELTARLHGVRLLVDECQRGPERFRHQNPWVELTEGTGWDSEWRPVDDGRRSDAAWLSPYNGDVMWELGRPLEALSHVPAVKRPPAPLVLDLPWYPSTPDTVEHPNYPWREVASTCSEERPAPKWWRIHGFIHTGFLTRLALFEPQEFGQEMAARRAAEHELRLISTRELARTHAVTYSVELSVGGYVDGRWGARRHVATAHLNPATSTISWTAPLVGRVFRSRAV